MGAAKRLMRFGLGGMLGAGVGAVVGILFAPQSGEELKGEVTDRVRAAQLAGAAAQAAKEEELIRKYRVDVGDPQALPRVEAAAQVERREVVAAIGLGLNAPGALAAHETTLRATGAPAVASAPSPADDTERTPIVPGAGRPTNGS